MIAFNIVQHVNEIRNPCDISLNMPRFHSANKSSVNFNMISSRGFLIFSFRCVAFFLYFFSSIIFPSPHHHHHHRRSPFSRFVCFEIHSFGDFHFMSYNALLTMKVIIGLINAGQERKRQMKGVQWNLRRVWGKCVSKDIVQYSSRRVLVGANQRWYMAGWFWKCGGIQCFQSHNSRF